MSCSVSKPEHTVGVLSLQAPSQFSAKHYSSSGCLDKMSQSWKLQRSEIGCSGELCDLVVLEHDARLLQICGVAHRPDFQQPVCILTSNVQYVFGFTQTLACMSLVVVKCCLLHK